MPPGHTDSPHSKDAGGLAALPLEVHGCHEDLGRQQGGVGLSRARSPSLPGQAPQAQGTGDFGGVPGHRSLASM